MDNKNEAPETRQDGRGLAAEESWLRPAWFALVLGAMVLASFPQVVAGVATFVARDFGNFSYPAAHFQRECFWRGELPLWNPYNDCGTPFLAQWNTMCLYPPALLYLLLPLRWSLGFFCLLHLWFGGLGMYFLAYRWAGNRLAASVAGVVFAFNGLSLNFLMWPSHIATFSWMPWVVLAVETAWRVGGRTIILAGLAGAMQMLAGGPETILFTWLLSLGLWGFECVRGPALSPLPAAPRSQSAPSGPGDLAQNLVSPDGGGRNHASGPSTLDPRPSALPTRLKPGIMAWRLGVVAALVLALSAAQLLPFLDLAAHSQRRLGFADTTWPMPARGWANLLVPMAFGHVWPENIFVQSGQYWTSSYYLGIGALLSALLAVSTVADRRVCLLLGAAMGAFLCALGDQSPVYPLLRRLIPQLTLITYPVKFVIVIVFAGSLLAGFGVAHARALSGDAARRTGRRLLLLCAVLLGLIGVILLWARRVPPSLGDCSAAFRSGLSRAAFLAAFLPVMFLLRRRSSRPGRALLPLALLTLLWLDVWTHEPPQNPTVSPYVYTVGEARVEHGFRPPPVLGESRLMVSRAANDAFEYRHSKDIEGGYLERRLGFDLNCNLLDEVPKVDGFFSLCPRESDALISALYDAPEGSASRLLDFLSVAHVTAPGQLTEFVARPNWLPVATAGQRPVFLDRAATGRRLTRPDFDGAMVVLLPPEAQALVPAVRETDARVVASRFGLRRVALEIAAAGPSLAVLSQAYYHWWRAYVDDQPAPLLLANYAFQAVPVPAGRHRVLLVYEDRAFQLGLLCSILTLLGCAVAFGLGTRGPWAPLPKTRPEHGQR